MVAKNALGIRSLIPRRKWSGLRSLRMCGRRIGRAGTDSANPIGSILSATMMLRDAFGLSLEADWIEQSVVRVLQAGHRTPDLAMPGAKPIGTTGFMDILHVEMQRTLEHAERYGWGV